MTTPTYPASNRARCTSCGWVVWLDYTDAQGRCADCSRPWATCPQCQHSRSADDISDSGACYACIAPEDDGDDSTWETK